MATNLPVSGAYARYQASDYNFSTNIWNDSTGNGNHIPSSQITATGLKSVTQPADTNNVSKSFTALQGSTASVIQFTTKEIPVYTLFNICRYTGLSNRRIIQGGNRNWVSGFWNGNTSCSLRDQWLTGQSNLDGTNWILSTDYSYNYRSNGMSVVTNPNSGYTSLPTLYINAGAGGGETSTFQIVDVIIFNYRLTIAQIILMETYLGKLYGIIPVLQIVAQNANINPSLPVSGAFARYQAKDYNPDTNTWYDSIGNGNNIPSSRITANGLTPIYQPVDSNNVSVAFTALQGNTSSIIQLTTAVIPVYTLFHICRYINASNQRIIQGAGTNWASGFYSNNTGCAYHDGWLTGVNNFDGTNWVLSTDYAYNYRSNSINKAIALNIGTTFLPILFINGGAAPNDKSGFQVVDIIIFNYQLSSTQIIAMEKYLATLYGFASVLQIAAKNAVLDAIPTLPVPGAFSRYQAKDYDFPTNTWYDSTGNGNIIPASRITSTDLVAVTQPVDTNNVSKSFTALQGSTSSVIQFTTSEIPVYTLFNICRYTGLSNRRIIQGGNRNWLSGFWNGNTGCSLRDQWLTGQSNLDGTNWILSTDYAFIYRSNSTYVVTNPNSGYRSLPTLYINAGAAGGETSTFQIVDIIIFNYQLTTAQIILMEIYLGKLYGITPVLQIALQNASPNPVLPVAGAFARYQGKDYNSDSNIWYDSTGNGNTIPSSQIMATGLTPVYQPPNSNNISAAGTVLQGNTSSIIQLTTAIIPVYTLFHICRYINASNQRIIQGAGTNWASGFYSNNTGCAYHDGWLTGVNNFDGTNWVLSTDYAYNYRSNGTDRVLSNNVGTTFLPIILINGGASPNETSGFQVVDIIIFNYQLSYSQILLMENFLAKLYGFATVLQIASRNAVSNAIPTLPVPGAYARYQAKDYDFPSNTWYDSTGNGNFIPASRITSTGLTSVIQPVDTNNVSKSFTVLQGSNASIIQFTTSEIPVYTLFNICRYTGLSSRRIIQGGNRNWVSGFWNGNTSCSLRDQWLTGQNNFDGTNWILSTDYAYNYRSNGMSVVTNPNSGYTSLPTLYINAGAGGGETSTFQIVDIIIFDYQLSMAQIFLMETYLGTLYGIIPILQLIALNANPNPTLPVTGAFARYQAKDYNPGTNTWYDSTGNGNTIPSSQITNKGLTPIYQPGNSNNVSKSFTALQGNTSSIIQLTTAVIPVYTLFHICRYINASNQRIIQGAGTNWLSGFYGNNTGCAYHDGWLTGVNNFDGTNWVLSADYAYNYRSNGINKVISLNTGVTFLPIILINGGASPNETSGFQVVDIIIFNYQLSYSEILLMENFLATLYGISSVLQLSSQNANSNAIPTLPIPGAYARYQAKDYDFSTNTWYDSTGNGNIIPASRINSIGLSSVTQPVNTNNVSKSFTVLQGTTATTIQFTTSEIPIYTLFNICRYTGTTNRRIIQGGNRNWISGFWNGNTSCSLRDQWLTGQNNFDGTNWILSTDYAYNYRSNGMSTVTNPNSGYTSLPTLYINAGAGGGETSTFQIVDIIIFNYQLTVTQIILMETYLATLYGIMPVLQTISLNTNINPTLPVSGAFARYQAKDYSTTTNTWYDSTGNGNTIPTSQIIQIGLTPIYQPGNSNNVSKSFTALQGSTSSVIQLTNAVIPVYTLFHICRYINASNQRIIQGAGTNWASGFYGNNTSCAYHDGWLTAVNNKDGTNWILSTDYAFNYRSNTVNKVTAASVGTTFLPIICINAGAAATEASGFQIVDIIIFDYQLSTEQILNMEGFLANLYGIVPILQIPAIQNIIALQIETLKKITAQNIILQNMASQNMVSQNIVSQNAASQNMVSQNIVSQNYLNYRNSQNMASQNIVSQNVASQNIASQNTVSRNIAKIVSNMPLSIPGIQLWLDSQDLTTLILSGNMLSRWNDKSGYERNATANNAYPTYNSTGFNNLPTIQFSLTTGMISPIPPGIFSGGICIFIVFQKNGVVSKINGLISILTPEGNSSPFEMYESTRVTSDGTEANYQYHTNALALGTATELNLLTIQISPTMYSEYLNSGSKNGHAVTFFSNKSTNFTIGSHLDKIFTGVISEIIVYNSILSATQQQLVEGYLAWKWNIYSNLPTYHPYYSVSPVQNIVSQNTASQNMASQNTVSQNIASQNMVSQNIASQNNLPISIINNDSSLLLYYSFESSTINSKDIANTINKSLVYNAQLANGANISTTDFKVGTASMQFVAASSQYIQINPFETGTIGMTFLFWCKFNNSGDFSKIFDFGNGSYLQNIAIGIVTNQMYCVIANTVSNNTDNIIIYTPSVNDNVWRHYALIINPSGLLVIYVNGVFIQNITNTIYPINITRNNNYLGKSNWSGNPYLNGAIDDFRMYNRILSANEISTIYSQNITSLKIASQNIASQNVASQNIVLQNIASQNMASQNIVSQNIASQNTVSQNIASQNTVSQNYLNYLNSQNTASQNTVSQNIASQNTVASQIAADIAIQMNSQNIASRNTASQNAVSQNMASQNMTSQLAFVNTAFAAVNTAGNPVNYLPVSDAYARYQGKDYNANTNTWYDSTGNGNNIPSSQITSTGLTLAIQQTNTNNAEKSFVVLQGTTASKIQLTTGVIPVYTLFHICRYTGGTNKRILQGGGGSNWMSGFWNNYTSCAYHNGWITSQSNLNGNNWIMSTDYAYNYRSNGVSKVTSTNISDPFLPILFINDGTAPNEASTFQIVDIIIFKYQLSTSQINSMEIYLAMLYGITSAIQMQAPIILALKNTASQIFYNTNTFSSQISAVNSAFVATNTTGYPTNNLPVSGAYARYQGKDYNFITNTWYDSTGNGNTIPSSQITSTGLTFAIQQVNTNNAIKSFVVLEGSTSSKIQLTTVIIPIYTLFHICRYTGVTSQRIIQAINYNWFSGFWSGYTGCAYHDGWITTQTNLDGTNWVLSTDYSNSYRSNGVSKAIQSNPTVAFLPIIFINDGAYSTETSTFQIVDIIIFDYQLTPTQIATMENYLGTLYGIVPILQLQTQKAVSQNMASQNIVSQNVASQNFILQNAASQNMASQNYITSQNMASQNIVSQNIASQNTVSQNIASQNMASQNTVSQNIASQNMASQNTVSQNIASQNMASQNTVSQNIASQNMASQNTVSQNYQNYLNSQNTASQNIVSQNMASQNTASQNIVSQNIASKNTVSQNYQNYLNSQNNASQNTASQNTASQNTASQNAASQNTVSQNMASRNTASQNTVSQNYVLQNAASQNTASQNNASVNAASQNTASQNTASQNTTSQNTVSQNTTSQNMASQNNASVNAASQNMASQNNASVNAASQNMASKNIVSQNTASQNNASQNMASVNAVSQNMASQNTVLQNNALINTASQNAVSQNNASINAASQNKASQNTSSINAASQNAVSQNNASINTVSQNMASQNIASQNTALINAVSQNIYFSQLTDVTSAFNESDTTGIPVDSLPITGAYARYQGKDYNFTTNTWYDSTGNGNTIPSSQIVPTGLTFAIQQANTNNVAKSFVVLQGSTSSQIQFTTEITPIYTLFHICRYTGDTNKRIIQGGNYNWLSGFWNGNTSCAFHQGWITDRNKLDGNNWILSVDYDSNYRSNAVSKVTSIIPTDSFLPMLFINGGRNPKESSTFQIVDIIIFNYQLSIEQILLMEIYLATLYGIIPILQIQVKTIASQNIASQNMASQNIVSQNAASQNIVSQNAASQNTASQNYMNSQNTISQNYQNYMNSQNTVSQNYQNNTNSQNTVTQNYQKYMNSQNTVSQNYQNYMNSQNTASQNYQNYMNSQNTASQNAALQTTASQNYMNSQNIASQNYLNYINSQNMASQNMASQNMASQNMASQKMASQKIASQNYLDYMNSQNTASQKYLDYMDSQNTASQNIASQNTASQNYLNYINSQNTASQNYLNYQNSQNTASQNYLNYINSQNTTNAFLLSVAQKKAAQQLASTQAEEQAIAQQAADQAIAQKAAAEAAAQQALFQTPAQREAALVTAQETAAQAVAQQALAQAIAQKAAAQKITDLAENQKNAAIKLAVDKAAALQLTNQKLAAQRYAAQQLAARRRR
jgi:hypothetical protein